MSLDYPDSIKPTCFQPGESVFTCGIWLNILTRQRVSLLRKCNQIISLGPKYVDLQFTEEYFNR
jgi:hypothetical protein